MAYEDANLGCNDQSTPDTMEINRCLRPKGEAGIQHRFANLGLAVSWLMKSAS
jgi:hypothetical protein